MGGIIGAIASGFLIGAAARWIVPGPDPMPFWLTALLGLVGSVAGGGIAAGAYGANGVMGSSSHIFVTLLLEVGAATALVVAYRRLVQQRPVAGPGAHRFPTKGVGVARLRDRLHQVGIDPEQLSPRSQVPAAAPAASADERPGPDDVPASQGELEKLVELRDKGILTDEEFEAARSRLGEAPKD